MKIRTRETKKGTWNVTLNGKLTIDQLESFKTMLDPLIIKKTTTIIVDFSAATFLDSSGLGMLLTTANRAKSAGIDFILRNVPETIRTILNTAKVDSFFVIQESNDAADGIDNQPL